MDGRTVREGRFSGATLRKVRKSGEPACRSSVETTSRRITRELDARRDIGEYMAKYMKDGDIMYSTGTGGAVFRNDGFALRATSKGMRKTEMVRI